MSGSSAIVVATFKALLRHYGLCAADLGLKKAAVPEVILSIERDELGISAGLQDRVIQTYGGLVAMDFGPDVVMLTPLGCLPFCALIRSFLCTGPRTSIH